MEKRIKERKSSDRSLLGCSTQPMDSRLGPLWLNWGKLEEAEEKGHPVEGPAVSTDLDLQDLLPPTRQHIPTDMKPLKHIQQKTA